MEHWVWLVLTSACLLWYSTITFYVAVKGFRDILNMLKRLTEERQTEP